MGFFDGIDEVETREDYVYFTGLPSGEEGCYLSEIKLVKAGKTLKSKVPYFLVETTTLESNNPARPVGGKQNFMVMVTTEWRDTKLGNIKKFLAAALDIKESEVDAKGVDDACSAANPLAGMRVRSVCKQVLKKDRPKGSTDPDDYYTQIAWSPGV